MTAVDYRLEILDSGGQVANSIPLDCDDDYHALVVVSLRLAGRAAELWQSDRMVGAYGARTSPPPIPASARRGPNRRSDGQRDSRG